MSSVVAVSIAVTAASIAVTSVSLLSFVKPEFADRIIGVIEKLVGILDSKDEKKDSDMNHENRRGRAVNH